MKEILFYKAINSAHKDVNSRTVGVSKCRSKDTARNISSNDVKVPTVELKFGFTIY